jgi:hypothetical protein
LSNHEFMNFNPHSYPGANPGGFRSESNEGDDACASSSSRTPYAFPR